MLHQVVSIVVFILHLAGSTNSVLLPRAQRSGFGSAEHVIFGCDGFGGMYLENATSFLPNVNKFYTDGAHTTRARDQMPSVSAPNWATIITGMDPEESGIPENYWLPPDGHSLGPLSHLPPTSGKGKFTLFEEDSCMHTPTISPNCQNSDVALQIPETMWHAAKSQDSSVVVAVTESWDWIYYLVEDTIVDYNFRCQDNDSLCAQEMSKFVVQHKPNLMFIHFDSIDSAGHSFTWGSAQYYNAVKAVDGYIGEIMRAFEKVGIYNKTLFILTADHGGYMYSHGEPTQVCMYIPALFMGPQVKKGYQISGYTTDKDFAPTALNALGLHPGEYMVGKVVEEIYET